ncbi:MAG: hypothetical protein B7X83_09725, partial [Polynucleobacter sp. 17-46-58]
EDWLLLRGDGAPGDGKSPKTKAQAKKMTSFFCLGRLRRNLGKIFMHVAIVLSLPYNGSTASEKNFVSARVALSRLVFEVNCP